MKDHNDSAALLEAILDRHNLSRPIPAEVRERILLRQQHLLVRILKTIGIFSFAYAALLSLSSALKKSGVGAMILKLVICAAAASAVVGGGYYLARLILPAPDAPRQEKHFEQLQNNAPPVQKIGIYEIRLYNGRVIRGTILSRGDMVRILSEGRIVTVPRNQIQSVKPSFQEK